MSNVSRCKCVQVSRVCRASRGFETMMGTFPRHPAMGYGL